MAVSMQAGFPPIVTLLEVHLFLAPRTLKARAMASIPLFPTRSIVAGSAHGVKMAKLFLGPILERVRIRCGVQSMIAS
eukprot:3132536-Pyramimonas_sp.AAC.1